MKQKKTSIREQIILLNTIIVIISFLTITATIIFSLKNYIKEDSVKMMNELSGSVADNIRGYTRSQLNIAEAIAEGIDTSNTNNIQNTINFLKPYITKFNLNKILVADINGNAYNTNFEKLNVADREYFIKAMLGESNVSSPLIDKITGNTLMVIAAPIRNNKGDIVGVLALDRDARELSKKISQIRFRDTGKACLLDKDGTTIAHYDFKRVQKMENIIQLSKKDKSLETLGQAAENIINGKDGFEEYDFNGVKRVVTYKYIPELDWYILLMVDKKDLFAVISTMTKIVLGSSLIVILIGVCISYEYSEYLRKRLNKLSQIVNNFGDGNFHQLIDARDLSARDEIGEVLSSINQSQNKIQRIIKSTEYNSNSEGIIIEGSIESFNNSLKVIMDSISISNDKLNNLLSKRDKNTNIEELVSVIKTLDEDFKFFINTIVKNKESIKSISRINEIISAVSEQTNLLVLNAAIEISRTDNCESDFAIVAEEMKSRAEEIKLIIKEYNNG